MSLSKYNVWEPPFYNLRGREVQYCNAIHGIHDLFCGCDSPRLHTLAIMFFPSGVDDDSVLKSAVEKLKTAQISTSHQLCLTGSGDGGDITHSTGDGPDILDQLTDGDLERLFEDDIEEGDATDAG